MEIRKYRTKKVEMAARIETRENDIRTEVI